jgi:hypothetical protein
VYEVLPLVPREVPEVPQSQRIHPHRNSRLRVLRSGGQCVRAAAEGRNPELGR